jgi:[protein-PII] uridylyltransferase
VVEVRAHDALGLLYAITSALSELDLDIHVAKIDTQGRRVVDVFYVRNAWGAKLGDEQALEVERAIVHRVQRFFGTSR